MNSYLEQRNAVIDLLRALTMAMMLMVNDFWSVSGIPHWMEHAASGEDMLGFSDIVFPTFLFCVGLSIPYAIAAMRRKGRSEGDVIRHILERSFALILMGAYICNYEYGIDPSIGYDRSIYSILMTVAFFLVFNHYTNKAWPVRLLKLAGWAVLLFLLITSRSPEGRTFYPYWWGILGLIGWAYLFCALVYALAGKRRTNIIVWMLLFAICLCCSETASYSVLEGKAILHMSEPNIVQLILSTLHLDNASSHLLVMSGVMFSDIYLCKASLWSRNKKTVSLLLTAGICIVVALLSHQLFITSKLIGTLPWIFYTLAIDMLLYLCFDWIVSVGRQSWFSFLTPAGTATLTCYMLPYILYPLISMTVGWDWSYAVPAPLGFVKCMAFSGLCIALTWLLVRLQVKLKI